MKMGLHVVFYTSIQGYCDRLSRTTIAALIFPDLGIRGNQCCSSKIGLKKSAMAASWKDEVLGVVIFCKL
jgi:hypothetical protein